MPHSKNKHDSAHQLVENFFRHEHANLVSVLSRMFGLSRLELIEETVQSAMLEAMNSWKQNGLPKNPTAWIHRVAKNRILDEFRREEVFRRAMSEVVAPDESPEQTIDRWLDLAQIPDSLLRMIFVCCHPTLDRKSQLALILKVLCGFGVREISRGLLLKTDNVKKRIQRARAKLADENVSTELPSDQDLHWRIQAVHESLYLIFNEGYSTSRGPDPIRDDLCEEAARLCHILCNSQYATEESYAILGLMLYHGSRLESRTDEDGNVVLLEDQDRNQWDQNLIGVADHWIAKAGPPKSRYHLEAAIAMLHCHAVSFESTNWNAIVGLYSRLIQISDSPIYRLNRAIAVAQTGDDRAAMQELESLDRDGAMDDYILLDCAIAKVLELSGETSAAIDRLLRALSRKPAEHEKVLIEQRIRRISNGNA